MKKKKSKFFSFNKHENSMVCFLYTEILFQVMTNLALERNRFLFEICFDTLGSQLSEFVPDSFGFHVLFYTVFWRWHAKMYVSWCWFWLCLNYESPKGFLGRAVLYLINARSWFIKKFKSWALFTDGKCSHCKAFLPFLRMWNKIA